MEEFSKSIKAFLYERSSSPLFGAFVVAWLGWNYRAIVTLFSEESLADKFLIIDRFYKSEPIFGSQYGHVVHGLLIPAAIALVYIFIYPILAKPVYKYSLKKQQELRKIKQEEENLRLLTAEESRELYKENAQLRHEIDSVAENYRKQITSLTQTINDYEKQLAQGKKKDAGEEIDSGNSTELMSRIPELLKNQPDGIFELSELFGEQQWKALDKIEKQAIGRKFREMVGDQIFSNIEVNGKGPGNQWIYSKKQKQQDGKLKPEEEEVLSLFTGLKQNRGYAESDIRTKIKKHIELVRMYLEGLDEKDFLRVIGETDNGEHLYALTASGRKYLVENGLVK